MPSYLRVEPTAILLKPETDGQNAFTAGSKYWSSLTIVIEHRVPFSPQHITGLILIVQVCRTSSEGAVGWTPTIL